MYIVRDKFHCQNTLETQNPFFISRRLQNANGALSRSANQMRVILALGQSGISNFALVRKIIKKNTRCLNQSAFSNFALFVINSDTSLYTLIHVAVTFSHSED